MKSVTKLILLGLILASAVLHASAKGQKVLASSSAKDQEPNILKCDRDSRSDGPCPMFITQGCICYNNGRCEAQGVNYCQDCQSSNVYGVIYLSIGGGDCPSSWR